MTINIKRPSIKIIRLPSGAFTYCVDMGTHEFHRREYHDDVKVAQKKAKGFEKLFDDEASAIEQGAKAYFIMEAYVDNGFFRRIRKVNADATKF